MTLNRNYKELLPDTLNIQHKITDGTEKKTFHLHPHLEMIYAVSDNMICRTEQGSVPLPKGSLLLMGSMTLHYIDYVRNYESDQSRPDSEERTCTDPSDPLTASSEHTSLCDRYVLYFSPDLLTNFNTPEINLLDCFVQKPEGTILKPPSESAFFLLDSLKCLENEFHQYEQLTAARDTMNASRCQLLLKFELGKLLLYVNQLFYHKFGFPTSTSYQNHSRTVAEVCRYIDTHYEEPLSVDRIAHEFLVSKTQLYYIFQEVLSMSVNDYLSQVRLTQAKHLLINSSYSVEIISSMVGYQNLSSFSRTFRDKVGISPLQYRKKFLS